MSNSLSFFFETMHDEVPFLHNGDNEVKSENEVDMSPNVSGRQNDYVNYPLKKNLSVNKIEVKNESEILSLSASLSNSILIEYMFCIIQGILKIGKEMNENSSPYIIKYIINNYLATNHIKK
jgi:hypothetical protein